TPPVYLVILECEHPIPHPSRKEACMSARRYGPQDGQPTIKMSDYHQSKDELAGLPVTVAEKIPVTNTPNIFSYKSYVFAKNPALVQRFIKATKADVGGVGGHVVAADEVKSIIAKYVLDNNSYRGEPIFTSLIVTHTGDDCAVTGIMAETVDMSVVDELMWDALQEGGRAGPLRTRARPGGRRVHRQPARRRAGDGGAAVPGPQGQRLADRAG